MGTTVPSGDFSTAPAAPAAFPPVRMEKVAGEGQAEEWTKRNLPLLHMGLRRTQ